MWIANVVVIFTLIILSTLLLWTCGDELGRGGRTLLSGLMTMWLVTLLLLLRTLQGAIVGALAGGCFSVVFAVSGAPMDVIKAVAIKAGIVCFAVLMLKAGWECWNNLCWGIRNDIRNSYVRR